MDSLTMMLTETSTSLLVNVKPISDEQNLKVFYWNQMSDAYKADERV